MLKLFLCLKYLRKTKIMLLSILAVAFSCAILIVIGSLFKGFINSIESSAGKFMGDIVITPKVKITRPFELVEHLISYETIEAATPVLTTQGLLHIGKGQVKAVNVWGIDIKTRASVTQIKDSLLVQKEQAGPLSFNNTDPRRLAGFVSIGLIAEPNDITDKYNIEAIKQNNIGKTVVLTTGSISRQSGDVDLKDVSRSNITNFKTKKIPFKISDVVFSGIYQLDNKFVYLPIGQLSKKLYGSPDRVQALANIIHVKVKPGTDPKAAVSEVWNIWTNFAREKLNWSPFAISSTKIETSRQMQAEHIAELKKQMAMLLLIFGIVSCAVVLLVFCIFYMIVMTRVKDIAIMKSFGSSSATVMSIFLFFGIFVGIIGAGLGLVFGYYITRNVNHIEQWIRMAFGLKLWDSSVYMFTQAPNVVNWSTVAWVLPAAVVAAGLGALIPALTAARIRPVRILQYE